MQEKGELISKVIQKGELISRVIEKGELISRFSEKGELNFRKARLRRETQRELERERDLGGRERGDSEDLESKFKEESSGLNMVLMDDTQYYYRMLITHLDLVAQVLPFALHCLLNPRSCDKH